MNALSDGRPPLPAPIRPRVLVRSRDGFGYVTSDGRYRIRPVYAPTLQRGSAARPTDWIVADTTGKEASWSRLELRDVREALCAPGGIPWLVCGMDEGVLRVEPSMRAAVRWARSNAGAPVRSRSASPGGGSYDYVLGHRGEDTVTSVFVMRADVAHRHGFDPVQQPRFPYPDDPHEMVRRAGESDDDWFR
ncbi:hypothetical protein [Streptomyces griseus]|uniref:hypothetical protein n=1 Tax=Streptomyces griseus TaxID=1911 RepID=UPI0037AB3C2F